MKILLISHFREPTGWGRAARNMILAMDKVGLDVVPRSISFGQSDVIPERILELEKKDTIGCDVCIQFLLPQHMQRADFKRNICYFDYECSNFQASGWPYRLSMFEEIWVPCREAIAQTELSNVHCIPHCENITRFQKKYDKLFNADFAFYFIGESGVRKNLSALLKAYYSEFYPTEKVSLIIKTSMFGKSPQETESHVRQYCNEIKNRLRIYPKNEQYQSETIITNRLTEDQMMQLHASCHCLVSPSYGEAFCFPVLDALGMGNPVIANSVGGHLDLVNYDQTVENQNGFLISNQDDIVNGVEGTFDGLYTGLESWKAINTVKLKEAMREMYESRDSEQFSKLKQNAIKTAEKFSFETVGNLIKGRLCS